MLAEGCAASRSRLVSSLALPLFSFTSLRKIGRNKQQRWRTGRTAAVRAARGPVQCILTALPRWSTNILPIQDCNPMLGIYGLRVRGRTRCAAAPPLPPQQPITPTQRAGLATLWASQRKGTLDGLNLNLHWGPRLLMLFLAMGAHHVRAGNRRGRSASKSFTKARPVIRSARLGEPMPWQAVNWCTHIRSRAARQAP